MTHSASINNPHHPPHMLIEWPSNWSRKYESLQESVRDVYTSGMQLRDRQTVLKLGTHLAYNQLVKLELAKELRNDAQ